MERPPLGYTVPVKVQRVIDGDTVEVQVTKTITVRLDHVWAPEVKGKEKEEGLKSKDFLQQLLAVNHDITLHIPGNQDLSDVFTFGRAVGRLWVNDKDVNEEMVKQGFATQNKVRDY